MKPIESLEDLNAAYRELFHLEDDCVLPLLAATVINAKCPTLRHAWLYLVGPASGGKSSLLAAFGRVTFSEYISDFTVNTLLSGARAAGGQETSLLKRLGSNFVVIMKDFTTILSKSPETQDALMGQLREVYDGYLRKETGHGLTIEWGSSRKPNRSVFIMASTEAIHKVQERFSEMGSRGINYVLKDADRTAMTLVAMRKDRQFDARIAELQDRVAGYISAQVKALPADFPDLPDDLLMRVAAAAEFVTRARSVVLRDYRGEKSLALSSEMPARVATQLQSIAKLLIHLNGGEMAEWIERTVMKCALDCIPKQSLLVLRCMAEYPRAVASGIASRIGYPSQRVTEWLENLNMHRVTESEKVGTTWYWKLVPQYRDFLVAQLQLERRDGSLEGAVGDDEEVFTLGTGNHRL